jgi:hypothetical protein
MPKVDIRPLEGMAFNIRFSDVEEVWYPNSTVGHAYSAVEGKLPKSVTAS